MCMWWWPRCCCLPSFWSSAICWLTCCWLPSIRGFAWSEAVQRKYKFGVVILLLVIFHAVILFAGFFAPYGYAVQNRELPFAPPTGLHLVDQAGKWHVRPFVYALADDSDNPGAYRTDASTRYALYFFVQGAPYKIAGIIPSRVHLFGVSDPGHVFLMGTDEF